MDQEVLIVFLKRDFKLIVFKLIIDFLLETFLRTRL